MKFLCASTLLAFAIPLMAQDWRQFRGLASTIRGSDSGFERNGRSHHRGIRKRGRGFKHSRARMLGLGACWQCSYWNTASPRALRIQLPKKDPARPD